MKRKRHDISIVKGEDFSLRLRRKQPDGRPVDLTGCMAAAQIRAQRKRNARLIADFIVTIPDPVIGEILVGLPKSVTLELRAGLYFFDLLIRDTAGQDLYYVFGDAEVVESVTVLE